LAKIAQSPPHPRRTLRFIANDVQHLYRIITMKKNSNSIKKYTVIGVFPKIKYHVIIPVETTGSRFSYSLVSGGDVMTVYEALSLMIAFASLVVLILSYRK